MKLNKKIILLILTLILFIIIYLLKVDKLNWFDQSIYNFISSFHCNLLTLFFKFITKFGSFTYIFIFIIVILIFIKDKLLSALISINSLIGAFINKVLKSIFVRPRPDVLRLVEQGGYSFPSGHAMASTIFYGMLIYLIYKSDINSKFKHIIISFLIILILLIGISRIYLGVHYASDIIAGYLVSIIYLIIFISFINKVVLKK